MRIAIIELNFHYDSLDSLCRLFDNAENQLYVFTTRQLYNRLSDIKSSERITFYLQDGLRIQFIRKYKQVIDQCDFTFINTITKDYRLFSKIKFSSLTIARVHNCHKMFDPWNHVAWPKTPLRWWKTASYILRDMLIGGFFIHRKRAIRNIDFFTFPDDNMQHYAMQQKYIDQQRVAPVLPIKFFTEALTHPKIGTERAELVLTVIGAIDFRRKNYNLLLKALEGLTDRDNKPVLVYFLGKASGSDGDKLKAMVKAIQHQYLEFVFYDDYVELQEFKRVLAMTDLIMSAFQPASVVEIYLEYYGKSKTSGTISDMITFATPITINDTGFHIGEIYDFIPIFGSPDELTTIINEYLDNPKHIEEKRRKLLEYLQKNYAREVLYEQFVNFVRQSKSIEN